MTARDEILGRIRSALRQPTPHHHAAPSPFVEGPPWTPPADLVALFSERFIGLGGHLHRAESTGDAVSAILEILRPLEARRALVSDDGAGLLRRLGVAQALEQAGIGVVPDARAKADADTLAAAITGIDVGLAETGTLAALVQPGQGRLASVVTPVHIAVATTAQIVPSIGTFLERIRDPLAQGIRSAAVFVAGPSRTGDIELTLSVGVHGPGTIHLVLLSEPEPK